MIACTRRVYDSDQKYESHENTNGRKETWLGRLGAWGAAQAAAPVITNITVAGATTQFSIESDLGITNQIQYSTNLGLANWTALTNVVVTNSPYLFVDVNAPPASYRFYRVAALGPPGMVLIPAGDFTMGDTFGESDTDELPLHTNY